MKHLLLLSLFALSLHAGENLAPGIQYPKLVGEWAPSSLQGREELLSAAEITAGHHYVLHPVKGKASTALYHTTNPAGFDPANTKININALHLVAEFPVTEAKLIRTGSDEQPQWRLVGKRAKTQELQAISLTWKELAPLPPLQRGDGPVRVALFDDYGSFGKGVPRCTELLSQAPGVKVTIVKPQLIREGGLKDFDVVIFTGGSGGKQAGTLGLVGREQVRRFIEAGGGYVGICAGNYLACDGFSWGLQILDAKTKSSKWARGVGDVKIEFTPKGREILGMPEGLLDIRYANGPVFNPAGDEAIPDFEPLAFFRSELAENGSPKGAQVNSPAMVAGSYGKGRLLCSSPHPEQQAGMEAFILKAVQWVAGP
ncbi:hypothetical protein GCM10023213_04430 [Prosthecobacter algae]|uniref:Biotin-protein ligase N-terminal domain-containing protein n=1 Tax=Prosthecobacter algae TaxID=1144682 RepID=A0ABP9NU27_9BACT